MVRVAVSAHVNNFNIHLLKHLYNGKYNVQFTGKQQILHFNTGATEDLYFPHHVKEESIPFLFYQPQHM